MAGKIICNEGPHSKANTKSCLSLDLTGEKALESHRTGGFLPLKHRMRTIVENVITLRQMTLR